MGKIFIKNKILPNTPEKRFKKFVTVLLNDIFKEHTRHTKKRWGEDRMKRNN